MSALRSRVDQLELEAAQHRIAREYFGNVLAIQTGIFSLIVILVLGVSWFTVYLRAKGLVNSRAEASEKKLEAQGEAIRQELQNAATATKEDMLAAIKRQQEYTSTIYSSLRSDTFRALGWAFKSEPQVAYLWFLRAAAAYEGETTRVNLSAAIDNLKKLKYRHDIEQRIEEVNQAIAAISTEKHGADLAIVRAEVDRIYANFYERPKPTGPSQSE